MQHTLDEMIEKIGITMTAEHVSHRPDTAMEGMTHYRVTLSAPDKPDMVLFYSVGSAYIEREMKRKPLSEAARAWMKGDRSIWADEGYRPAFEHAQKRFKPDIQDVVDCLASDAAGYDNAWHFADWAAEYGYDDDSIKIRGIYDLVGKQSKQLRDLCGEHLNALLHETERL